MEPSSGAPPRPSPADDETPPERGLAGAVRGRHAEWVALVAQRPAVHGLIEERCCAQLGEERFQRLVARRAAMTRDELLDFVDTYT